MNEFIDRSDRYISRELSWLDFDSRVLALADGVLAGDGDPAQVLDAGMIQTLYGLKVKAVDIPSGGRDVRVFLPDESKYRKEM